MQCAQSKYAWSLADLSTRTAPALQPMHQSTDQSSHGNNDQAFLALRRPRTAQRVVVASDQAWWSIGGLSIRSQMRRPRQLHVMRMNIFGQNHHDTCLRSNGGPGTAPQHLGCQAHGCRRQPWDQPLQSRTLLRVATASHGSLRLVGCLGNCNTHAV